MGENRRLPQIPPPGEKIPILIDTDCGCEVDDQHAIALAVHAPDRFDIQGFVATHYHDDPASMEQGPDEIRRVLELCGTADRWPVKVGGPPLQWSSVPSESEGADFIIDQAMAHSPEGPLWIVILGATTNTVSAWLKQPEIADRVVVLFHGRTQYWPEKCLNFNVVGDLKATRALFRSDLPLVLFDTGTYLRCPAEETERRLAPLGAIGKYLHQIRMRSDYARSPKKGFFDLGDIAFLIDPALAEYEEAEAPGIGWDLRYDWRETFGSILRVYQIDRPRTFELLFSRLAAAERPEGASP